MSIEPELILSGLSLSVLVGIFYRLGSLSEVVKALRGRVVRLEEKLEGLI